MFKNGRARCLAVALAVVLVLGVLGASTASPVAAAHEVVPMNRRVTYDLIMQTCASPEVVPDRIAQQFEVYAPGCTRVVLSDPECVQFLRSEFGEAHVRQFHYLSRGAHKADLVRYAWLYKHGGVYMDIKTILTRPISELFPDKDLCYVLVTEGKSALYNGIIATPPHNPMILEMLDGAMRMTNDQDYLTIVQDSYDVLTRHLGSSPRASGAYPSVTASPNVHVYMERFIPARECDFQVDVHGACTFVTDGERTLAKIRDPTYPWPTSPVARAVDASARAVQRGSLCVLGKLGLDQPNNVTRVAKLTRTFRPPF